MCNPHENFTQEIVQFFFGTIIGYVICSNLYRGQGEIPHFAPTVPMIGMVDGHHYIGSVRIHHWMWGLLGFYISVSYNQFMISGVCFVLMIHGLSYNDCFDF